MKYEDKTKEQLIDELKYLQKTKESYNCLIETITFGIEDIDLSGNILFANSAQHQQYECEEGELIGKNILEFLPSDEKRNSLRDYLKFLVKEQPPPTSYVGQKKTKKGRVIEVEVAWNYRRDNQGQVVGFTFVNTDITERKRIDEKLKDSEKKNRTWLEHSPVCTKIIDLNFNLQYMSTAGINALKIDDITQFYGKPYPFDFYPELPKDSMTKNLNKVKETGKIITQEASVANIDGKELWYQSIFVPVNDAKGRIEYIMVVSIDTTERKQSEEKLLATTVSKDYVENILKSMVEVLIVANSDATIKTINQATLNLLGYEEQELIEKNIGLIFDKEQGLSSWTRIERLIQKGVVHNVETICLSKDGRRIPVLLSGSVMRDKDGQIQGIICIINDITELKQAEEKLKRKEDIIESATSCIATANLDGQMTYGNPAFLKVWGFEKAEEFLNKPILDYWAITDRYEEIMEALKTKGEWKSEIEAIRKDGSFFPVHISAAMVFDAEGNPSGLMSTSTDITERKQLEVQLQRSSKMEGLGNLAGGIAHEFNNIMGAILGNAEIATMNLPIDSDVRENLENISKSGERAANLVRQIMTFSRMDVTCLKPINISSVVKDALQMVRSTTPVAIEIRQNIPKECFTIMADTSQIYQIILNLCINACQAMGDGVGVLEVTLKNERCEGCFLNLHVCRIKTETGCLQLVISDTGSGIPLEDQGKIFDPFFTTKEIGKGTGLGLAVVHGIIEKHQGMITVESKIGKGTTFSIFFPTIESEVHKEPTKEPILKKVAGGTPMRHILIAEDEPFLVNMYQKFLEGQGYIVTTCGDGSEALALFKKNLDKFDLVFTDQAMPKMPGKYLSQELLKIKPELPIILATGYSDLITEEDAKKSGIRKYLNKPIALPKLSQTIAECLKKSD